MQAQVIMSRHHGMSGHHVVITACVRSPQVIMTWQVRSVKSQVRSGQVIMSGHHVMSSGHHVVECDRELGGRRSRHRQPRDLRRGGRPREAELTGDLGGGGLDALRQLRAPLHEAVALRLGAREEHLVGGR